MSDSTRRPNTISTKLTDQMVADLERLAERDGRSVSEVVYLLIRRELYGRIAPMDAAACVPLRPTRGPAFTVAERSEVFKKSDGTCAYCLTVLDPFAFEVDHIVPVAKGGARDPGNLVAACKECNRSKRAKDVDAFKPKVDQGAE